MEMDEVYRDIGIAYRATLRDQVVTSSWPGSITVDVEVKEIRYCGFSDELSMLMDGTAIIDGEPVSVHASCELVRQEIAPAYGPTKAFSLWAGTLIPMALRNKRAST